MEDPVQSGCGSQAGGKFSLGLFEFPIGHPIVEV